MTNKQIQRIKNVRMKENIWWKLSKIKVEKKLKSIEAVIELLIKELK